MKIPERHPRPKLLMVIVDIDKAGRVESVVRKNGIPAHIQFQAEGTADSELLDIFGLGSPEKAVSVCILPGFAASRMIAALEAELELHKKGNGVALTMPVSGAGKAITSLAGREVVEKLEDKIESEVKTMKHDFHMIWAVLNQGYSDEMMEAVRRVGATGGTVISARRVGGDEPMKFWGITVQEEKEIILIAARAKDKSAIMEAIASAYGFRSEAQGMVFSLPVESIAGLDEDVTAEKGGV